MKRTTVYVPDKVNILSDCDLTQENVEIVTKLSEAMSNVKNLQEDLLKSLGPDYVLSWWGNWDILKIQLASRYAPQSDN